jgi:hypothetical protein
VRGRAEPGRRGPSRGGHRLGLPGLLLPRGRLRCAELGAPRDRVWSHGGVAADRWVGGVRGRHPELIELGGVTACSSAGWDLIGSGLRDAGLGLRREPKDGSMGCRLLGSLGRRGAWSSEEV